MRSQNDQQETAPGVRRDALEILSEAMALVESGEVLDVAVCMVRRDDSVATSYSGGNRWAMVASATYLLRRLTPDAPPPPDLE